MRVLKLTFNVIVFKYFVSYLNFLKYEVYTFYITRTCVAVSGIIFSDLYETK